MQADYQSGNVKTADGGDFVDVLPDLFSFIFKNSAQHRLKIINAKLAKLSENWSNILPDEQQ